MVQIVGKPSKDGNTDWVEGLGVGDLHLEKLKTYFPHEDGDGFVFSALNQAVRYAVKHDIKYILQGGDVYDSPFPQRKTERRLYNYLRANSMPEKPIEWLFDMGNHDVADVDTNSLEISTYIADDLNALPGVRFFSKPAVVYLEGVPVCFLPYPHTKPPIKGPALCVGHFEFRGAIRDNGMEIDKDHGVKLDRRYTWLNGHLHRTQPHYMGTLLQYNFGEPLPKGFIHWRARLKDSQLEYKRKFVPIETPYRLINVDIHSLKDFAKIKPGPNDLFKFFIKADIIVPREVWGKYRIFQTIPYKNNAELKAFQQDKLVAVNKEMLFDPMNGLEEFLAAKGLKPKVIRRGLKQAHKELQRVGGDT